MFIKAAIGGEIHAMSSCAKPLSAWIARDAIQECREACGGHGYLAGTSIPIVSQSEKIECYSFE